MKKLFKDWTVFEKVWLTVFTIIILSSTLYFSYEGTDYANWHSIFLNWLLSPVSAITGIMCVVLVAKGKLSNYYWGFVNASSYAYLAYISGYYGDFVLNAFFFLPVQFIGFFMWRKMLQPTESNEDVIMKKMNRKQITITLIVGVVCMIGFGLFLENVDNWFTTVMQRNESIYTYFDQILGVSHVGSMIDASTEVLQILATILMLRAYAEQWLLWIMTNIISILMWSIVIIANPSAITWALPILIMWIAYLVNSFYGYYNWLKGAKNV